MADLRTPTSRATRARLADRRPGRPTLDLHASTAPDAAPSSRAGVQPRRSRRSTERATVRVPLRDPRLLEHRLPGAAVGRPGRAGDPRRRARSRGRRSRRRPPRPRRSGRAAPCATAAAIASSRRDPARAPRPGRRARPGRATAACRSGPGATALTSTPRGAQKSAYRRESECWPPWRPSRPATSATAACRRVEVTLTIRPQPRSAIGGREVAHQPHRRHHVELERRRSSRRRSSSSSGLISDVPALLTRMSTGAAGALGDPLGRVGRGDVDALRARDAHHARALRLQQRARPPRRSRASRPSRRPCAPRCPGPWPQSCAQRARAARTRRRRRSRRRTAPRGRAAGTAATAATRSSWPARERARPRRRRRACAATARRTAAASRGRPRDGRRMRRGRSATARPSRAGEHVAAPQVAVQPRRRLRRAGQLRQPRDHRLHRGAPPAGSAPRPLGRAQRAARAGARRRTRASRRAVARGQLERAEPQAARTARPGGGAPNAGAPAACSVREAAPERLLARRVEPPLVDPREREEARRRRRRTASTSGTAQPAAGRPSQRSPAASVAYSPRPRAGARLDERARRRPSSSTRQASLMSPPATRRARASGAPERPAPRPSRRSQPAVGAQGVEQAAAGRLDEVEHVLEAVVAAVVGVGHVEVGRALGRRVELAQQVQPRPRAGAARPPRRSRRLRRSAARIRS